jgi:hypothetical protein
MRLPDDSQAASGTNDPGSVTPPPELGSATPPPDPTAATAQPVLACDECGAPVDADQRYCVVCGAHRRNVNDPATRYLSQASAKARRSKTGVAARRPSQFGGSRGASLALVIVIALIPVAAAVGVLAGRSSNNDDSNLISALKHRQSSAAQTTVVHKKAAAGSAAVVSSTNQHHAANTSAKSKSSKSSTGSKGSKGSKSGSGSSNGKTTSKTSNTSSAKIVGFKATNSQKQQGAAATQKVQKSTGKNFVNGQNSLPGEVVVP